MDAKELRIGNGVHYEKENFKIHSISPELPCLDTIEFGIGVVTYENIYPIEFSEDILIKCGFKDMSFPGYKPEYTLLSDELNLATIEYDSKMNAVWLCFEGTICGKKLKYLHHLQNLYYCLTGKELEITL